MLKYFIDTTQALITAALITGLVFGYARAAFGKAGRYTVLIGSLLGVLSGGVMAYLKNATKKIDTSMWNLRIFSVSLAVLVLFLILSAVTAGMRSKKGKKAPPKALFILDEARAVLLAVIVCGTLLYALPDVFTYPYSILLVEKSVLSTTFIVKVIGILFGLGLVFLAGLAANRGSERLGRTTAFWAMTAVLAVNAARQVTVCLRVMLTKRMIASTPTLFNIAKNAANHDTLFIYLSLLVCLVVAVLLWARTSVIKEPYSNPAEHRKLRKKRLVSRRWGVVAALCLVMTFMDMTVLKAATNKTVELSPVEDTRFDDENVYVTFEQVEDGHLHRFAYVTENGVQIRFIVIKKPNSSSYGIGLDACDICGETGYYEKDGQVVCKLCDVVMNINTIGFKGGCNPIVIPYTIENGSIIVPIEGLVAYEHEFK